jgi:hypothetical protein
METIKEENKERNEEENKERNEEEKPKAVVKTEIPISEEPDLIYYNIKVSNPIPSTATDYTQLPPVLAQMNQTQSTNILESSNDYQMAVIRFKLPASIPAFIYDPKNQNFFQIQFTYTDGTTYNHVEKVVEYKDYDVGDYYPYGVSYISHYLDWINTALIEAFNDAQSTFSSFPASVTEPPFIFYVSSSNLIKIRFQDTYRTNGVQLRVTSLLQTTFFPSMPVTAQFPIGLPNRPIGEYFPVIINIFKENNPTLVADEYEYASTEFGAGNAFNQLDKIFFVSDLLPVENELIQSSNNQSRSIIIDFSPEQDEPNKQYYNYSPSIYRWYNLVSNEALRSIDMKVFLLYSTGESYQLYLNPNELMTIKILFRKKKMIQQN